MLSSQGAHAMAVGDVSVKTLGSLEDGRGQSKAHRSSCCLSFDDTTHNRRATVTCYTATCPIPRATQNPRRHLVFL